MNQTQLDFITAANAWICDGYSFNIRYLGYPVDEGGELWSAVIEFHPLRDQRDLAFEIKTHNMLCGHVQRSNVRKDELLGILGEAGGGVVTAHGNRLRLPGVPPHNCYSEMTIRDRWFYELHLQTSSDRGAMPDPALLTAMDNDLRTSQPPFDGLLDLCGWLGVSGSALNGGEPTVVVRVGPPVDLLIDRCTLRDDQMKLHLRAHSAFDVARIGLAIRGVPGVGLAARQQIASKIDWANAENGMKEGFVQVQVENADSVLVVLMIGSSIVRRNWFLDPTKARNNRFLAVQHFDVELRKIRFALLDSQESRKFEQGIAALLFLLGCSPVLQLETDSPDLVVSTPVGQLALVECTIKIADFSAKLGKLVDRRGALAKAMTVAGHPAEVAAVLVCQLPRDQIAMHEAELRRHKVLLFTKEDLVVGLERVRFPADPDEFLRRASAAFDGQIVYP